MKDNIRIMMRCFFYDIISNIRVYLLKTLWLYPFYFLFVWKDAYLSYWQYVFCLISIVCGGSLFFYFYCLKNRRIFGILSGVCLLLVMVLWGNVNKHNEFENKGSCLLYKGKWDNNHKICVGE